MSKSSTYRKRGQIESGEEIKTGQALPASRHPQYGLLELCIVAFLAVCAGALGTKQKSNTVQLGLAMPATVFAEPAKEPEVRELPMSIVFGIAFFENGTAGLDDTELVSLRRWGQALAGCQGAKLRIRGSTSSVVFRAGSQRTNLILANERARAAASILVKMGVSSVEIAEVKDDRSLLLARYWRDNDAEAINLHRAAIARRVDLLIDSLGSCSIQGLTAGVGTDL